MRRRLFLFLALLAKIHGITATANNNYSSSWLENRRRLASMEQPWPFQFSFTANAPTGNAFIFKLLFPPLRYFFSTSFHFTFNSKLGKTERHSQDDIIRSRKLLQSTGQLPKCEMNLKYTIGTTAPDSFSSQLTLSNNRELGSNWQLVFRYHDYTKIKLSNAVGATVLTFGSTNGAPVRLVDPFTLDANGEF